MSEQAGDSLVPANAIKGYSESMQVTSAATELTSPEDEFVQAVKAVAILGKFPQGLNFSGKVLVPPQKEWAEDFTTVSPTGFHPLRGWGWNYYDFIGRCFNSIDENKHSSHFPQVADLMKKHFLAVIPYDDPKRVEEYKEGYALLIYNTLQDESVRDRGGRHARVARISFLMPMNKAQQFIQLIEEKDNGADIVEQFVQKAAPGVMASNLGESGAYRVQASELVVLGTKFLNNLLTQRNSELLSMSNANWIGSRFLESVDKAVVKPYSQPVGFGIPPS
ncbi:MAG: hypothetical protein Q7R77_03520 [Candidatus Daviesbacteria bacterium]|nr:hypothetical protein [Candidatus Daviesbacteria bacterium]